VSAAAVLCDFDTWDRKGVGRLWGRRFFFGERIVIFGSSSFALYRDW
jgi:hypothetical protein